MTEAFPTAWPEKLRLGSWRTKDQYVTGTDLLMLWRAGRRATLDAHVAARKALGWPDGSDRRWAVASRLLRENGLLVYYSGNLSGQKWVFEPCGGEEALEVRREFNVVQSTRVRGHLSLRDDNGHSASVIGDMLDAVGVEEGDRVELVIRRLT